MSISRVTKAIAVMRRETKFSDAEVVRNVDIDVFLPNAITRETSQMAQLTAALVLRCFTGTLRVHGMAIPDPVRATLEAEANKVGGLGRLEFGSETIGQWKLALGHKRDDAVCADVSGWTARINGVFNVRTPAAAPAVAFAIACAVAKLFNSAILANDKNFYECWDFCLLRFSVNQADQVGSPNAVNFGRVALLGAGAIGSAVGCVLLLSNWSGDLHILDFDYFDNPNLETCILSNLEEVNRPLRKAAALASLFAEHSIKAIEQKYKIKGDEPILMESWDSFICAVDNPGTRRTLDNVNAKILNNAGLGASRYDAGFILWSQHGKVGKRLSDLYSVESAMSPEDEADVPEEFREKCSRLNYNGVSLSMPFVALVAGSLLAANLYQISCGRVSDLSFMQIDLFGKQQKISIGTLHEDQILSV